MGVDPNDENCRRQRALFKACESGRTDIAEVLLKHGAKIEVTDENGFTLINVRCTEKESN